jgi:hypothetical protein
MPEARQLIYHSFHLTDGMLVDFLNLVGVSPSRIRRYTAPDEPYHSVYVVDTRDVRRDARSPELPRVPA